MPSRQRGRGEDPAKDPRTYTVVLHGSASGITLTPSPRADCSHTYRPSPAVEAQIAEMWRHRAPRRIGSTSEMMAVDIMRHARITAHGAPAPLECVKLRNVPELADVWRPKTGIYCDDLVVIRRGRPHLVFLTEVKGTTLERGLSHSSEAKMFYQLARTCAALTSGIRSRKRRVAGALTVVIGHFHRVVTINILDTPAILGFVPDRWLPGGHWR